MPSIDFDEIKRKISLYDVLMHIQWRPIWSRGLQERGPCPLHGSKSPRSRSFAVSGEVWYCHKCKKGGGWLELWIQLYGLNAYDAAVLACEALGREIPLLQRPSMAAKERNGEEERYISLEDANWTPPE